MIKTPYAMVLWRRKGSFLLNPFSGGNRYVLFFLGFFLVATLIVGVMIVTWVYTSSLTTVDESIAALKLYFVALRGFLFVLFIGGWPFWIRCLSHFINLDPNQVEFALTQRWRIAAWLIIIDLLLVQGMLADFLGSLVS